MTDTDIALAFLHHLAEGKLAQAELLLSPDFRMTIPGGVQLFSLSELTSWSRPRYRRIEKCIERTDASPGSVYVSGTLRGQWTNGSAFDRIRFIDRFEMSNGLILRQEVWNDMAEHRP